MAYSEGIIVIPARYNSHRLPGKALKDIAGKTMIRRTYERAVLSEIDAMVVTDDKRIVDECLSHDIPVDIVTAPCFTGTDRVARFAQKVDKKWFINLQGDEPFQAFTVIKKTFWLKLIQRTWKKIYQKRKQLFAFRNMVDYIRQRELGIKQQQIPTLYGMLSYLKDNK